MRLPEWLRASRSAGAADAMRSTKSLLRSLGLSTVCEEARCPNRPECFTKPTAAFMLLGDTCTRGCGFCSVVKGGVLMPPDPEEPARIAEAARAMGLRHVVLTSVTRDDLPDGGASHFALTVRTLKGSLPDARVEVLTPDFKGSNAHIKAVADSRPDVYNHNVETVPSLYLAVRPQADYARSLGVLRAARKASPGMALKSGLMLGLGETMDEVRAVLRDLREVGCDFVTIGQYLRPGRGNLPVHEYVRPEVFEVIGGEAMAMGFRQVSSSPLARSSMHAGEMYEKA